ncbi:ABC transporter [Moelleriella libera RCEF 2490]|uniref:ABC transporter n=1 Tax=Moelleriella libera RCEF 2490 TaxID=1081109 RepID=A0A168ACE7_9HYPO|nr:ABC transporter [Moelleriella libera RCEF 2490]
MSITSLSCWSCRTFAEPIIGHPGEGLNIELRKRLAIGAELAACPKLLVFRDEPTSGLDAQTSRAIPVLIRETGRCQTGPTLHHSSALGDSLLPG